MTAFVNAHTNLTEIDESLKLLWRNNIDPSKVVLGLGFYGRSFTLQDPSCIEPGCPFTGGAPAGPCTDSVGTLSFAEIETVISNGATVTLNEAAAVKIVTWDDNWVSYDDAETLKLKIDYANNNCLGGTMIWAASLDDAVGTASNALADAGSGSGSNILTAQDPLGVCALTACIDPSDSPCPSGQSAVYGTPEGCGVTNDQIAQAGTDSTFPSRWYCCPVNAMATCFLETPDPNSEGCSTPACQAGTVAVLTTSSTGGPIGCPNSPKNLCCSAPEELTPRGLGCFWTSCGVNSASTCPSDTAAFVSSTIGQDGSQAACLVGDQTLCCPTPLAIDESTCSWHNDASLRGICLPGCPSGQMEIADDVGQGSCILGSSSYCCDPPASPQSDAAAAVLGFKAVAEEFMTEGACLAVAATKRQQRRDLAPRVTVLNMAQRLVPLLLSFNFEQAQLAFILPFQEAWDAAIATTGSLVPSWASLAKLLTENKDQIQEFFETIADGLCDNILSSTFDPILCSLDTCSGGDLCPISTLDKRLMGATPADVTNQFFSTAGVTNAVGFSDPLTFGPGVVAWWTQVKNLDWWLGSNHGVSSLNTQQAIASSFYIDFDLSPGQNLFTGAGPVWGCTTVAVVSDKGAWTAHFWQSFFEDFGDGNLEDDVLTFLANGNAFEGYPGLVSLASVGGPFHPDNRKFLNVIIMTPQLYVQLKLETWSLPTIVNLPGLEYPSAVASMQLQLSLILGTTTAATVRSYPSDQAIWKYVPYPVAGERGTEVRFIWVLNRSPRLANAPWTGMLTVQRTATNNFDVVPSVRIWVANTVVVTSTW